MKKAAKSTPVRENDLLSLSAALRSRRPRMLNPDKLARIVETGSVEEAVRAAAEIGFPPITAVKTDVIEDALSSFRAETYDDVARCAAARPLLNIFRAKYDIHNVKVLVKSMSANEDSSRILSRSGSVAPDALTEAFITGERNRIPRYLRQAISAGVGALARTSNPNLADTAIDRLYYEEILIHAEKYGTPLIKKYVRLLIDCANLRIFVRSVRAERPAEFLASSLFGGGYIAPSVVAGLSRDGADLAAKYKPVPELARASELAAGILSGGRLTEFERECDNVVYRLAESTMYTPFGQDVVFEYLLALDWQIVSLRMALTGLYAGIEPSVLAERLREYV
ncbi:MAG: V-type ATPase subunit [Oscillospiraceae bacterium]|nr:V-type ATPase subunit [Oscillospiraceae bacterium]